MHNCAIFLESAHKARDNEIKGTVMSEACFLSEVEQENSDISDISNVPNEKTVRMTFFKPVLFK